MPCVGRLRSGQRQYSVTWPDLKKSTLEAMDQREQNDSATMEVGNKHLENNRRTAHGLFMCLFAYFR